MPSYVNDDHVLNIVANGLFWGRDGLQEQEVQLSTYAGKAQPRCREDAALLPGGSQIHVDTSARVAIAVAGLCVITNGVQSGDCSRI